MGARHKSVAAWDGVEERVRKILGLWKCQYMFKGGRLTFIRSKLSSLPIYYMSIFQLPKIVQSRLDQLQKNFLWGGAKLEKKPHLVKWLTLCLEKESRGSGVKDLGCLNKTLLSKWCWRFAAEKRTLWNDVIMAKYGEEEGGWCSCEVREGGIWGRVVEGNMQLVASCLCYIFFYSRKWERTKVLKEYLVWGDALVCLASLLVCYYRV